VAKNTLEYAVFGSPNPLKLYPEEISRLEKAAKGVSHAQIARSSMKSRSGVSYLIQQTLKKIALDGEQTVINPEQALAYLGLEVEYTDKAETAQQAQLLRMRSFIADAYSEEEASLLTDEEVESFYHLLPDAVIFHKKLLATTNRQNLDEILDRVYSWVYLHEPSLKDETNGVSRGSLNNSRRAFAKAIGKYIPRDFLLRTEV
jgi:hypothetical protein